MPNVLRGTCLCGSIRYEVHGTPLYAGYCHCSECRKFSGSAFSAIAGVRMADLRVEDPGQYLGSFRKTGMSTMRFCTKCGSSMFVEKTGYGLAHLRLGTLDGNCPVKPQGHVHVASKAAWYELPEDGLPRFPEGIPEAVVPPVSAVLDEIERSPAA